MMDGLKDLPILPVIKVLGAELVHHILDAERIDEHGAQHRLLTFKAVGHLPKQQFVHHLSSSLICGISPAKKLIR